MEYIESNHRERIRTRYPLNFRIDLRKYKHAQIFAQIRAQPKRAQKLSQIFVQIKTQIEVTVFILTSICAIFYVHFEHLQC